MSETEMKKIKIGKVVVNMGVGDSGEELINAENILEELTNQEPMRTHAKQTLPTFGIREGEPIGCKVTLRGQNAKEFLKKSLEVKNNKINKKSIDEYGNFSFGIDEHTNFPEMEYDPNIGIFGLDISVRIKRPGYKVKETSDEKDIADSHKVSADETEDFLETELGVEVVEKDE